MAIDAMIEQNADEVRSRTHCTLLSYAHITQIALETEVSNTAAMKLYERLGFLRSKRLHRYYLNGNTAFRFVLYVQEGAATVRTGYDEQYENGEP